MKILRKLYLFYNLFFRGKKVNDLKEIFTGSRRLSYIIGDKMLGLV